jgi:hypothetical protein
MSTWFTDWTPEGRFETADGDRCALMTNDDRAAVMWSYTSNFVPQFTEYVRSSDARTAFRLMRDSARSKAPLAYDSEN